MPEEGYERRLQTIPVSSSQDEDIADVSEVDPGQFKGKLPRRLLFLTISYSVILLFVIVATATYWSTLDMNDGGEDSLAEHFFLTKVTCSSTGGIQCAKETMSYDEFSDSLKISDDCKPMTDQFKDAASGTRSTIWMPYVGSIIGLILSILSLHFRKKRRPAGLINTLLIIFACVAVFCCILPNVIHNAASPSKKTIERCHNDAKHISYNPLGGSGILLFVAAILCVFAGILSCRDRGDAVRGYSEESSLNK